LFLRPHLQWINARREQSWRRPVGSEIFVPLLLQSRKNLRVGIRFLDSSRTFFKRGHVFQISESKLLRTNRASI